MTDTVWGGDVTDKVWGVGVTDKVWGGGGTDKVWGVGVTDTVWDGDVTDKVWGGGVTDKVWGGGVTDLGGGHVPGEGGVLAGVGLHGVAEGVVQVLAKAVHVVGGQAGGQLQVLVRQDQAAHSRVQPARQRGGGGGG